MSVGKSVSASSQSACSRKATNIDQIRLISRVEIVYHGGLVQMCQLGHIVGFVELGRVDLVDLIGFNFALLPEVSALCQ